MVTITCLDNNLAGWRRIFESLCLLLYFVVHSALRLFVLPIAAMSNDSSALQIPTPGLEDSYSGDEEARQRSTTTEQEERSPQVEKKQLTPRQRNDSGEEKSLKSCFSSGRHPPRQISGLSTSPFTRTMF